MDEEQIVLEPKYEALNRIHEIALSDDHIYVPFSKDNLKMANAVIENMEKKLKLIADIAQDGLGD